MILQESQMLRLFVVVFCCCFFSLCSVLAFFFLIEETALFLPYHPTVLI